jgi:hypothetical protein
MAKTNFKIVQNIFLLTPIAILSASGVLYMQQLNFLKFRLDGIKKNNLNSYLDTASSASLDDETDNIFGYIKRRCC